MSQLGHREPGLVGATLDDGGVSAGLIADGVQRRAERRCGWRSAAKRSRGGIFLVTDAMPVAGTGLTDSRWMGGGSAAGGRLTLEDGTLAGADFDSPARAGS